MSQGSAGGFVLMSSVEIEQARPILFSVPPLAADPWFVLRRPNFPNRRSRNLRQGRTGGRESAGNLFLGEDCLQEGRFQLATGERDAAVHHGKKENKGFGSAREKTSLRMRKRQRLWRTTSVKASRPFPPRHIPKRRLSSEHSRTLFFSGRGAKNLCVAHILLLFSYSWWLSAALAMDRRLRRCQLRNRLLQG